MKRWAGAILSILFIALLLLNPFTSHIFKPASDKNEDMGKLRIALVRDTEGEEKGGGEDSYYFTLLKQIREKVEAWLKSLNERIEREDITHFEVRFYEILRNILEWAKEKLDSKIESSEEQRPKQKEKRGRFRETRQRGFPIVDRG